MGRNFSDSSVGTVLAPPVREFAPLAGEIVLHNVGTLKPTSGNRLGGALPGIDTPTLKGVWQSAPYFHDGHAATLQDVFDDASAATHFGGPLTAQEKSDLVEYMLEIDEIDAPPVDPLAAPPTVTLDFVSTGKPYSLMAPVSGCLPWIDRSYVMGSWPGVAGQFTLIRTAEDDKDLTTLNHMQVTVTGDSYIHILYDMRKTALPDWMITGGWSTTPVTTLAFPGQNVTMGFFFLHLPAGGTVMLGGNMAPGAAGALRNYFVAVYQPNPTPVVVNEGPLNKNEWAHDHDADGDGLRDQYEVASATDPFHADTGPLGTIPDEDRLAPSGKTFFQLPAAGAEAAAAASSDWSRSFLRAWRSRSAAEFAAPQRWSNPWTPRSPASGGRPPSSRFSSSPSSAPCAAAGAGGAEEEAAAAGPRFRSWLTTRPRWPRSPGPRPSISPSMAIPFRGVWRATSR
jgi:hypothetical protein